MSQSSFVSVYRVYSVRTDDILMWMCEFQTILACFSLEMELNIILDVPL